MIAAEVQEAYRQLRRALGISLHCGQIVLNVNNDRLSSVDKVQERIPVPGGGNGLDKVEQKSA